MNTNINPSTSTEEQHAATNDAASSQGLADGDDAPYETPIGATHRTFELSFNSTYELWLLTTMTMGVGERLWVGSFCPFIDPVLAKMTFRQGTLELPELTWLLERVLNLSAPVGHALPLCVSEHATQQRPLRWEVLSALARHIHGYLDLFDVIAMVKHLAPVMDRAHFDVAALNVPSPRDDLPAFERHMRICRDCLRLAYVDDTYLR